MPVALAVPIAIAPLPFALLRFLPPPMAMVLASPLASDLAPIARPSTVEYFIIPAVVAAPVTVTGRPATVDIPRAVTGMLEISKLLLSLVLEIAA
ncbi:hypothetical protein PJU73_03900 [Neisseria lisongii]|uniref:Secreted peptide n=1 Tax=Neisseria lisongii TaxID=2912188 RepID=A0ABY7RKU1_9NEIS|nr:hypothetical protein [Neisseria lisongii]WCL72257.1 hypothetical protein PJU73_03900 [Neisseria lisongii]